MINCLLCNVKLELVADVLKHEYGYLCANCKVSVLRVGKNAIDSINSMDETVRQMKALPLGAFSHGNNLFPSDLLQQQRLYNETASIMTENFKPEPISANQVMQWQKQEDVEKGQLFPNPSVRNRSQEEFRREYIGEFPKVDPHKSDNKE